MKIKKIRKFFSINEFEKEQEFLQNQHKEGWKFVKVEKGVLGGKYYFEECEPEEWIYRLDYKGENPEDDYLQMFKDYGWKYITNYYKWSYFARKSEEGIDTSIFSDNASEIDMYLKIQSKLRFRITLILLIALCVFIVSTILFEAFPETKGIPFFDFMRGCVQGLSFGSAAVTILMYFEYRRLKKRVLDLEV